MRTGYNVGGKAQFSLYEMCLVAHKAKKFQISGSKITWNLHSVGPIQPARQNVSFCGCCDVQKDASFTIKLIEKIPILSLDIINTHFCCFVKLASQPCTCHEWPLWNTSADCNFVVFL